MLAGTLRERQSEILARWKRALRECAPASRLAEREFADHLAELLTGALNAVEAVEAGQWDGRVGRWPEAHAHSRMAAGLEVSEVITEYFLLRHLLLEFAAARGSPADHLSQAQAIGWAVDAGIRETVAALVAEKHRILSTLDRLASVALESRTQDGLLQGLLGVILDEAEGADTLTLFLLERDKLRLRAAAGLEQAFRDGFELRVGEGVAGRVARERRPYSLHDATGDPAVRSAALQARGVRGLHAVPLISGGDLVGVLMMGSLTLEDFSERDKTLLRAIADRAAGAIVQQKLRDEASRLAKSREETLAILHSLYETAPIGLALVDRELRFVQVNEVAAAIGGKPAQDYVGRRLAELNPDFAGVSTVEERWRKVLETGEPALDIEMAGYTPARPEQRITVLASLYPVKVEGEVVGVGIVTRDVTTERAALEFQQHVLGIVSHDLRAPLSVIALSATVLLREESIPERAIKALARVKTSADRMEQIVRDLTDFTRIRAGQPIPIDRRPVDLVAIVRQVLGEAEALHSEREFRLAEAADAQGEWDPGRLAQVVSNLVSNAVTHGAPGTPVTVQIESRPDTVAVEVANQGRPIDPHLLPHIFEAFRRGSPTGERRGLGLGLFITRELVRRHEGNIGVRSDEHDTRFRVTLPRHPRSS